MLWRWPVNGGKGHVTEVVSLRERMVMLRRWPV